jgi:predicted histone-like DNA-binding protein
MTIKVTPIARKNPLQLERPVRYYAGKVYQGEITMERIAKYISNKIDFDEELVTLVIDELLNSIQKRLEEGKIVRINDMGSLSVSLHSHPSPTPDDFSLEKIKKLKVSFKPTKSLKNKVSKFSVKKI